MAEKSPILTAKVFSVEARSKLTRIEKDQFPYALAKSLTDVAWGSVEKVRDKTKRRFNLATEFIPKGVSAYPKVGKVKSNIKSTGIGETVVFTKERISTFMPIHEDGGTRKPSAVPARSVKGGTDKGVSLSIPGNDAPTDFKTGSGKVKAKHHPRKLLKGFKGQNRRGRRGVSLGSGGKRKAFITKDKSSGTPILVRRLSRNNYPLEVLYIFAKKARVKPRWDFDPAVRVHVKLTFERTLARNLKIAVATSK